MVFTIPKVLRGIFRKRRQLRSLLFQSAIDTLTESSRPQLGLAEGKLGAVAAVHTFGDYLIFHPHIHVLVADGLFAPDGRFHCLPQGAIGPMTELFRHRFLAILREKKLISPNKLSDLPGWKHSGFHVHDGRDDLIGANNRDGRKRLAEPERSGDRQPNGCPQGERSESISSASSLLAAENHLERHQQNCHLPLQAPSQHLAQLRDFQGSRLHRRRTPPSASKRPANGEVLRCLLQQDPWMSRGQITVLNHRECR
jgi:hypothetical protein